MAQSFLYIEGNTLTIFTPKLIQHVVWFPLLPLSMPPRTPGPTRA